LAVLLLAASLPVVVRRSLGRRELESAATQRLLLLRWRSSARPSDLASSESGIRLWLAGGIWIVGAATYHWNGSVCSIVPTGVSTWLYSVWGTGPRDVWAVGDAGVIIHWDGSSWSRVASGVSTALVRVAGSGPNDVWTLSFGGDIFHLKNSP
jgi:hypothetical protein